MFLLITIIIQSGTQELFFTDYKSKQACVKAKEEAEIHDNEVTKVRSFCLRGVK